VTWKSASTSGASASSATKATIFAVRIGSERERAGCVPIAGAVTRRLPSRAT